jgi:HicB family
MPARKRTGLITTNTRLPEALHKKLTQRAARRGIPLNTLLIEMLEGYDARHVKRLTDRDAMTELAKHVLDILPDDARKRMIELIAQTGWETVARTQPKEQKKAVGEK